MKKEKKYCPKCGIEVTAEAKFCSECGNKFVEKKEEVKEEKVIVKEVVKEPSGFEKSKKYIYPILSCFVTLVLCLIAFTFFYKYYMKNLVIETTRTEKEVTITETGISESVDKVYDSVVVIENYVRGQLYATGSGFVYKTDDNKGYILTNNHVIANASEVKIVFSNNKKVTAKVVGSDAYSDVALLSVDKENVISVAEIGSSEDLKVGDTAFAIGAPLDSSIYAWTVTRGIISGKNRTVQISTGSSGYGRQAQTIAMEVLQTDAAINNGNSGGALCNSNGEVIGITNMKLSDTGIEGMGFAIPIEDATFYADAIINGEDITRPVLGIAMYEVKSGSSYRIEGVAKGVGISRVFADSPAERSHLMAGDVIVGVDNVEVTNIAELRVQLYKHKFGDKVNIKYVRSGQTYTTQVDLFKYTG